ncbi:hypothetical protein ACHAW5_002559 [Stephanodiscus triporus]|uniref:ubiquitinyl hydrolase 1 n=1 Tax=Stephanodiscus triporus TaxID=2934178 RepID=A0ABD3MR13_9STRA
MPPFRQPTPSPPPPPIIEDGIPSSTTTTTTTTTMAIIERADPGQSSGTGGFEIPPNFVPPPPPREVGKFPPTFSFHAVASLTRPLTPPPPPPTGVTNLGNTCYMNAALQALAHAPELCHALDAECHLRRCPVALRNEKRRRRRARGLLAASAAVAPTTPPDGGGGADGGIGSGGAGGDFDPAAVDAARSHRRSHSASSDGSAGSGGSSRSSSRRRRRRGGAGLLTNAAAAAAAPPSIPSVAIPDYEYCTLCEVERLLGRVHSRPEEAPIAVGGLDGEGDEDHDDDDDNDVGDDAATLTARAEGPFVPEAFVSGFMSKVAPWFRRGVQEDSHEFLRLLIDAMQTSCKSARASAASSSSSSSSSRRGGNFAAEDDEYPFRLFRGTVESNVTCSACRSTSCKIDPIEDIGLDILPVRSHDGHPQYANIARGLGAGAGGGAGTSMSSSRSTSPTSNMPLADVTQALERFISSEHLDSGYKCERCGKLGKATKTSKLASIPPILTLHLKRFRYGSGKKSGGGGGAYYQGENGGGTSGTRSSGRSARGSGAAPQGGDYDGNVGPSGSAKIEGHVGFGPVLDMKPYLTPQLQQTVFQKAICRLFAVVVHSGKNSHSGHYVAYVHNVTKKEWWMMDDAKVVRSSWDEVRNAEAYMLFYRVTSHPVAMQLKSIADQKEERARRIMEEIRRREEAERAAVEAKKAEAINAAKAAAAAMQDLVERSMGDHQKVPPESTAAPPSDGEVTAGVPLGKRQRPAVASGEEWARVATILSPEYIPLFTRIQEFIAENVTFSPEFFGYITEEYNRMNSKLSIARRVRNNKRMKTLLGKGPGGVYPPEDVIAPMPADVAVKEEDKSVSKDSAVTTEFVPAISELIIPQDNVENYDGAL